MKEIYSIEDAINALDLRPGSDGWYTGRCPHPDHEDLKPSFGMVIDQETGKLRSYCHACIDQETVFRAAIDTIRKSLGETKGEEPEQADCSIVASSIDASSSKEFKKKIATQLWEQADFDTDIVQGYLTTRGLSGVIPESIRQAYLEYVPMSGNRFPTMIAEVTDSCGRTTGIHRTFLSEDENGNISKAAVDSPKKALGAIKGNSVHLSDDYDNALHLTEGLETAIAVQEATGVTLWAVLSAKNLSSVVIPDDVETVYIWADHDRSGTGEKWARKAAEKFVKNGKQVFVLVPEGEIPDDQNSVDWLDMGSEAIVVALGQATEFKLTPDHPWGDVDMPEGYVISKNGVFFEKETKTGVQLIPVSTGPLWLSGKRTDVATRETELEISWCVSGRKNISSRWLNRGQLLRRSTLLEMVELEGFPVYDGVNGDTVKYLARLEQVNQLKTDLIVRKPGWNKNTAEDWIFTTGQSDRDTLFHPESAYQSYAVALKPAGAFEQWLLAVRPMMERFPIVLFSMLAVLCAPLLRVLGAPNFIVDLWGRTSVGKTTLLQIIASAWGKPSGAGGLILSWNNTIIFSERLASFFGEGLPIFFDDSQTANDKLIESITYMVANGTGKGRAKPYSLKSTDRFQVVMFATGEKPITEMSYPGAKARVMEINGSPFPEIDPNELQQLKNSVMHHYGHLGERYVEKLVQYTDENLNEVYEAYQQFYTEMATNEIGNRFAGYYATIRLAGDILASTSQMEWVGPLISDAVDHVWEQTTVEMDETDMAQKALIGLAAWIESNKRHFASPGTQTELQPTYGIIKERDGFVAILPHIFKNALRELDGQSSAAVIAEWKKKGFLDVTPGRNQKQVKVEKKAVWCFCVSLNALYPNSTEDQTAIVPISMNGDVIQPILSH